MLYISDLDGTLLDNDSRVSDASRQMLNKAIAAGVGFSVATARTPATVDGLLKGIDIRLPLIVMTGAALWDMATNTYIDPQFIDLDLDRRIRSILADNNISPFVYTLDQSGKRLCTWHNGPMSTREQKFADERSRLKLKRLILDHPDGLHPLPDTLLYFITAPAAKVFPVADELTRQTHCCVSAYHDIFNHEWALLEIFAPGVSKAARIDTLKKMAGDDSVTVFGDNLNDIGMMRAATYAVAVENAFPRVKEQADIIIGPNTSDAVPRFILRAGSMRPLH